MTPCTVPAHYYHKDINTSTFIQGLIKTMNPYPINPTNIKEKQE
jgi:hypothetical protein